MIIIQKIYLYHHYPNIMSNIYNNCITLLLNTIGQFNKVISYGINYCIPPCPATSPVQFSQISSVVQSPLPPRSSAIPLVDFTSRFISNMKQKYHHHSSSIRPFGHRHMKVNGKPLLDLSSHKQKSPPLPERPKQWNNSPSSGDVFISIINVAAASSSFPITNAILWWSVRSSKKKHLVLGIERRIKCMRIDRVSVTLQQQQSPKSFLRMVDSLVSTPLLLLEFPQ